MKHGKRPTVAQKKTMQAWHLNPADWMVCKDTTEEMHLVHKYVTSTTKIIPKE